MKKPLSFISSRVSSLRCSALLAAGLSALLLAPGIALAEDDASFGGAFSGIFSGPSHWRVAGSPYTLHFRSSPEHRHVWALGAEKQWDDTHWLAGASYFSNSFGQDSGYFYVGKRYPGVWGLTSDKFFAQWSAGILYGYKGEFKDKVPLNYGGFSPGVLLSLGWQFTPKTAFTVHALGDAGLMFQFSYELN